MKKGKVILAAIAIFAIIGGALGSKAKNHKFIPANLYTAYTTTTSPGGPTVTRCALTDLATSITGIVGVFYLSTGPGDICLQRTTTIVTLANDF